jgi:hypothetical protein
VTEFECSGGIGQMQIVCRPMTLFEYFSRHPAGVSANQPSETECPRVSCGAAFRLPCGDGESMKFFSSCFVPPFSIFDGRSWRERYGGERNNFQIIPALFWYSFEQVGDSEEMHLSLNLTDLVFWYFFKK